MQAVNMLWILLKLSDIPTGNPWVAAEILTRDFPCFSQNGTDNSKE